MDNNAPVNTTLNTNTPRYRSAISQNGDETSQSLNVKETQQRTPERTNPRTNASKSWLSSACSRLSLAGCCDKTLSCTSRASLVGAYASGLVGGTGLGIFCTYGAMTWIRCGDLIPYSVIQGCLYSLGASAFSLLGFSSLRALVVTCQQGSCEEVPHEFKGTIDLGMNACSLTLQQFCTSENDTVFSRYQVRECETADGDREIYFFEPLAPLVTNTFEV